MKMEGLGRRRRTVLIVAKGAMRGQGKNFRLRQPRGYKRGYDADFFRSETKIESKIQPQPPGLGWVAVAN
jgi:hypothetical protein